MDAHTYIHIHTYTHTGIHTHTTPFKSLMADFDVVAAISHSTQMSDLKHMSEETQMRNNKKLTISLT